jgi:hypothetical protein
MLKTIQSLVVEPKQSPTFQNSWVDFGVSFAPAKYYKDPFGIVHLEGLIKNGASGSPAFTLPAGYRPSAEEIFTSFSNAGLASVNVNFAGQVIPSGGTGYLSISGITFRAA